MRVLILGAAVSGAAAARLARRLGHSATVFDQEMGGGVGLLEEGFSVVNGKWSADLLEGIDLVVASPGFSERSLPVVETLEAGVTLWSEIEFGWQHLHLPVAAVTGTNGKTTVTELVATMLNESGIEAAAGGNIGLPLSDLAAAGDRSRAVAVEVSSFQLRFVDRFHPEASVITNIAPDHLDWHGSETSYVAAKARIFENQSEADLLVYDADDPGAVRTCAAASARRVPVSGRQAPEGGYGVEGPALRLPGVSVPLTELAHPDPIWLVDMAAAAVAASHLGASPEGVAAACRGFRPGRHRRTVVARWGGVTWIDDSKATNPHAARASVDSYPQVVLICGGLAKGLDVRPLAAAPNVRLVVAMGEAGPVLADAAGPGRGLLVRSMGEAVETAARLAQPGDTVLLAPGCASYDMFIDYAARGEAFVAAVRNVVPGALSA